MGKRRHRAGRPYTRWKRQVLELWGDQCHLCGHPGATQVDHLIPLSKQPHQPLDPELARPAHGSNAPCPVCGRACNQSRGNRSLDEDNYTNPLLL